MASTTQIYLFEKHAGANSIHDFLFRPYDAQGSWNSVAPPRCRCLNVTPFHGQHHHDVTSRGFEIDLRQDSAEIQCDPFSSAGRGAGSSPAITSDVGLGFRMKSWDSPEYTTLLFRLL